MYICVVKHLTYLIYQCLYLTKYFLSYNSVVCFCLCSQLVYLGVEETPYWLYC